MAGRFRASARGSAVRVLAFSFLIAPLAAADDAPQRQSSRPDRSTHEAPTDSANWPSFRGAQARGVADGQNLPERWNGSTGENIRWKVRIPGLAHSSPIIWGDRLFVTTAVSSRDDATIKPGLYGDGAASEDVSLHRWRLLCLDKRTGNVLWEQTAREGVPRSKRHIKATYANCTPATDGRYVVAHFGAEGLYAYDMNGRRVWNADLGDLDVGAYDLPEYEWGPASSPVMYRDLVIAQCDQQKGSYLIAFDVHSGKTVWKTPRDELPSWGTPTIFPGPGRVELVTNGSNFIRGYDPADGKELWRLGGSSKITAPTPVFIDDLLIVCSGRRPEKPIFAIRAGAVGDITLAEGAASNQSVLWSKSGRGPYMPTPIIYNGLLYSCENHGILSCFDVRTGHEHYRERIPHHGAGFSASPVAADANLYLPSEDGDVFVIPAGPKFQVAATNPMGEILMASPALSEGTLYIRGEHHLFAVAPAPQK